MNAGRRASVITVALLVLVGAAAPSCAKKPAKECGTEITVPIRPLVDADGRAMYAETQSVCEKAPVSHSVLLTMA